MKTAWYFLLVAAICFEGLGRKYLPQVPNFAFYFSKDVVLLFGYLRFRRPAYITQVNSWLYRGFKAFWVVGFAWTVLELFNPEQSSALLGALGMRAYWLWWAAPPIIANILDDETEKRRAVYVLLGAAAVVSVFAAIQFALPATSPLNAYAPVQGEEVATAVVASTGRSRVASTFSYVSGFSDFNILIPTLIMSFGLDARDKRLRRAAFIITCLAAAVVPMSGSRSSVVLGLAVLVISVWSAGLLFTRIGRRILVGGAIAGVLAVAVFPEAFVGVQSRFQNQEETEGRFVQVAATALPPLALATYDYPAFGLGTGMLQNARAAMAIPIKYEVEVEAARYLVEIGVIGFVLIWLTKLGLAVALARAYFVLKRAGRRGAAAAALSYSFLTLIGNMAFDHIWQALFFLGCGSILAEVVSVMRERAAATVTASGGAPVTGGAVAAA
ncbi:MAG TPA: hypothetical protein VKQ32_17455 [Polyangia bacterium]|nr:hypothetical protein [Polyangia bacterium]